MAITSRWVCTLLVGALVMGGGLGLGGASRQAWAFDPPANPSQPSLQPLSFELPPSDPSGDFSEHEARRIERAIHKLVDTKITEAGDKLSEAITKLGERDGDDLSTLTQEQRYHILLVKAQREGDFDSPPVEVIVPVAAFTMIVLIVVVVLSFRAYHQTVRYRTIQQALDRGVDIPEELLPNQGRRHSDYRRGVLLSLGGLGLCLALILDKGIFDGSWGIGFFPLLIGLGYLVLWETERRGSDGPSDFRM